MGPPLIPGLADELTAAAGRLHRRRRRRLQLATAGALVVVFAGAMAVTTTIDAPPAQAGLQITERDGRIEARLTDVETRPQVVDDALADAGIDAAVVAVPVSPSLVGRFVAIEAIGQGIEVERLGGDGRSAIGFSVPTDFAGRLDLALGRRARPGEAYGYFGSALSAGEPLACLDLLGRPARTLATVAADHPDVEISVQAFDAEGVGQPVSIEQVATGAQADWPITDATTIAPDAVVIRVAEDGDPPEGQDPPPTPIGC